MTVEATSTSARTGVRSSRALLETLATVAFMGLLATLPLEWMSLGGAAGGTLKPFHLFATLFLGLVLAQFAINPLLSPIIKSFGVIFISWALFLVIATIFSTLHTVPYASSKDLIRQTTYAFTGLVAAGWVVKIMGRERVHRMLTWSGLVACVVLSFFLLTSLQSQGGSAVSTVKEAVAKSDPDIIGQQLLKTAFESNEDYEEAKVNLRHKVASGLLLAVFVGLAFRSDAALRDPLRRALFWASVAYGFAVVAFTFSRSITLALIGVLCLVGVRVLFSGRATPKHAAGIAIVVTVVVVILISPLGGLFTTRFLEETESYSGRTQALELFLDDAGESVLTGIAKPDAEAVPHNSILDAWLSAGIIGAVLALVTIGTFIGVWLIELRRYLFPNRTWVIPAHQLWVVALGVTPIVRVFTAANGFHMNEWTSVGVFLGCIEVNRQRRRQLALAAAEHEESVLSRPEVVG